MDILYDWFGENALVGVITVLVSLIYGGIMLYYTLRKRPSSGKKSKTSKEDLKASTGDVKGAAASAAPTSGAAAPSSNGDSASVSMKADRVSFYASSDHSHHRIKPQAQVFVLPPLRILLTDDSVSLLKVTKRALETQGSSVVISESGVESLEIMQTKRHEFDLWITDIQMPVMDGPESVRLFREWEEKQAASGTSTATTKMFVVGVSANGDDETRKMSLDAGMDLFLPKPMNYAYLASSLHGSRLLEELNDEKKRQAAAATAETKPPTNA